MRIGIDARQISHRKRHGLRTYVENLVAALLKIDKRNQYFLYLDSKDPFKLHNVDAKNTIKILPWHIKILSTLLNDRIFIPIHTKRDKLDLIHYPGNPVNFRHKTKTVVTIPDAIPFFQKGRSLLQTGIRNALLREYQIKNINTAVKSARSIITISEKSKEDLILTANIPTEKLHVIHLGVNENFKRIEDKKKLIEITDKFDLSPEFLLGFAHKSGARILQAYSSLPPNLRKEYKIGLICMEDRFPKELQKIISEKNIEESIRCIPPVSEEELVALYNAAALFVFPSLYEGFGLPVIEAMACACPVICTRRGSLPEVTGDAALYIENVQDISAFVSELKEKIQGALTDKELQARLIERGLEQAKKYSWITTARETLKIYESVVRS
jgi:glycosyltransferase involved in cell wall biosynthesis